jgi:hypothetical protein
MSRESDRTVEHSSQRRDPKLPETFGFSEGILTIYSRPCGVSLNDP